MTPHQDAPTQLSLRREALEHLACCARLSTFVKKADLAEAAARSAWNAALPFTRRPLLRAALVGPLGVVVAAVNKLHCHDKDFHVRKCNGKKSGLFAALCCTIMGCVDGWERG